MSGMNHSPMVGPLPGRARYFSAKVAAIFLFLATTFAFVSAHAQITEYLIPYNPSQPESMVAGPDGAYWFTEFYGQRIGRVDTNGVVTEPFLFASGVDVGAFSIIVGPDTNLWFAEAHNDKIARISAGTNGSFTNGILTEFKIHTNVVTNCQPSGITFGPDGNIWFL